MERAGRPKAPSNSPVGLGNQSPWSGEPWANHGEPGHGNSGKCPELRASRRAWMTTKCIREPSGYSSP